MSLAARIFAAVYDPINRGAEHGWLGRRRDALLGDLAGEVLEIGAGTGSNLPHYRAASRVVACEPLAPMRARLAAKLPEATVPVEVCSAPAEELPFPDASFDAVVATLVLCTVRDVGRALAEVRRVLRPTGELRFLEHGGAQPGSRGAWQRRLDPIWSRVGQGCHLTRDARANVEAAGFTITRFEEFEPRVPDILRPFCEGVARP